ncbi:hypothetical protein L1049_002893 [Liquidambar formosana]|uniref:hAT-like transposase RNase-H fold domain-containing protein n=1 Tax=Liquidambar formosana TaxID=63359 RepID=A0AAP0R7V3_LIQFO
MAEGMKKKFEKYWGNFDNSNMLLYVAVVLDPQFKLGYVIFLVELLFESDKAKELISKVRDALSRIYGWYVANGTSSSLKDQNRSSKSNLPDDKGQESGHAKLASKYKRHLEEVQTVVS